MMVTRMTKVEQPRIGRPPRAGEAGRLFQFRATADELTRWRRAASAAGMTLSAWLRRLADQETARPRRGHRGRIS